MNMRKSLTWISLALAAVAMVIGFDRGATLAAYAPPAKIPTCATGVSPPCTDYFGVPNYANSSLPAGIITAITVTNGGNGYTAAPIVTITDARGAGTGATATATIDANGAVISIAVTPGSGYIAPQVTIAPPPVPLEPDGPGILATASATVGGTLSGGIHKFVNTLPGLTGGARPAGTALGANDLGQYMPLANPDITAFPGSDYYVIGLKDHREKMHSDISGTTDAYGTGTLTRGYYQVNTGNAPGLTTDNTTHYLGPLILATMNRPTRVLLENQLPTSDQPGSNLFIPTDSTYMGAGLGPDGTNYYTQNREVVHLHGGATPWISDGTPHQWITPANETGTIYLKGQAFQNVPDMVGPGKPVPSLSPTDGLATHFWTNEQGGRLMFYHDHVQGMTRLNVYAGEAAGYLLVDPVEETALFNATAPGTIRNPATPLDLANNDLAHLVPLVIQDKTFVPTTTELTAEDPTWDTTRYGSMGNLWYPHVYMTNQDPADPVEVSSLGRWDYGPWFFPPQGSLTAGPLTIPCYTSGLPGPAGVNNANCPIIPNPSGTPEAFMDTPLINGTAYPVLHVAPKAYRFQILSAGNDRGWNLSWFVAANAAGTTCNTPGSPAYNTCTEVNMLPAVSPVASLPMPFCATTNPITNSNVATGLATGLLNSSGAPLNGTGLQASCWPSTWPTTTGNSAGLTGVVADPRNAGPAWIQIGTEGGLLPAPVVIPPTPTLYETNTKSITVLSVATHGLWVGPAERADVIVDFTGFGGKTLILYNDGPAPIPAYDLRNDYFTGNADNSSTGGAPPTLPGYGPNTRTIMQVVVDQTNNNTTPFSLPALKAAFASTSPTTGIFRTTQPVPVVPEAIYNSAYNNTYTNTYFGVPDDFINYVNFDGTLPGIVVTAAGSGYTTAPLVTFGVGCTTTPVAAATVTGGAVTAITLTNPGAGCTSVPTVTIAAPPSGTQATAISGAVLLRKTIQELFTLDYGRMNATLGTELPFTNFLTQTTIPLGYIDPPTEIFRDGETQVWRITHNGVDTHLIHFHLFNVQIINRIGWDNTLRKPDANEVGWKETVKMNPLEDIVVALRPVKQTLPFPIPDSVRDLDVTMPEGTTAQFTGIDPFTNSPMTVTNQLVNFGWEYVWHCHILGHEENDMMRPMIFQVPPEAPSGLTAVYSNTTLPSGVELVWTNNSVSATSFTIQRALDAGFTTGLTTFIIGVPSMTATPLPLGTLSFVDSSVSPATYHYRVAATKTFPARQSPTWGQPGTANAVVTEPLNSSWVTAGAPVPIPSNITVSPASGPFGNVAVSFTSYPITFTITNNGAAGSLPLDVTAISLSGADAAMFAINNGTCGTLPVSLASGASCYFFVSFTPTSTGAKTASVDVGSINPPVSRPLTGTGVAATNPVRRTSPLTPYSTLVDAFTAATTATTLQAWGDILPAPLVTVNSTGTVTFTGGYDALFATRSGTMTGMQGVLTIQQGTLVVDGLSIQ
jgi:FtsP/CotA-like multicopper oxidase with cupredoxin domain